MLSQRRAGQYRAEGRSPKCETRRRPPIVMTAVERARFKRWWLEESGLSSGELRDIAIAVSASVEPFGIGDDRRIA